MAQFPKKIEWPTRSIRKGIAIRIFSHGSTTMSRNLTLEGFKLGGRIRKNKAVSRSVALPP